MEEFGPHLNIHVQDKLSLELALEGIEAGEGQLTKESWFRDLPPVLLFNLNRFTFNKEKKCGEKLHNRLEFRETLFMDRYMRDNREKSKERFRQRRQLDDHLDGNDNLMKRLIYRENIRVPDALKCVIDLAHEYTSNSADLPESDSANLPVPGNLTHDQMKKIEELLIPWSASIDQDHQSLKTQSSKWRQERRELYDFPEFKKQRYVLNGVIIHQGEAGAGHYWAYVRDHQEQWWRCNDNEIKRSEYFEIEREGFGGSENGSSAYILIYQAREQYEADAQLIEGQLSEPQEQTVIAHDTLHLEQHQDITSGNKEALPDLIDNTDHYSSTSAQIMEVDSTQPDVQMVVRDNVDDIKPESYVPTDSENEYPFDIEKVYLKFKDEYAKKDSIDQEEQMKYREPNIKKVHFINSLTTTNTKCEHEKNQQKFLNFLHEFGTEDALFYLKNLLREPTIAALYNELDYMYKILAAFFEDLMSSYDHIRQTNSQNRDLDIAITSVEKLETSLWLYKEYNCKRTELLQKGFEANTICHDDLNYVLEEVLKLSTEVITSHIESTNEESALFHRLVPYRNIFVYLSRDVDTRPVQEWGEESDNSTNKVIEHVCNM